MAKPLFFGHNQPAATAPPFSPSDIAGLVHWLKADSLALANNAQVQTWTDSSSSGRNASQATSGERPLFKTSILNGLPVVEFDGSDDRMTFSGLATGTSFTLLMVLRDLGSADLFCSLYTADSGDGLYLTGDTGIAKNQDYSVGGNDAESNTELALGTWYYITVQCTAGSLSHYLSGVFDGTPKTGVATRTLTNIGGDSGATLCLDGQIAEILFYNSSLSAADRDKIHSYLADKYNLYDTDAASFFTRVASNGGTISTATKKAVNAFVTAAKSKGYWTKLNRINLFCGDQLAAALVPLKVGSGSATETNNGPFVAGDYTEATGLKGNGSSKYLNTGLTPSSALTQHNTHHAFYIRGTVAGNQGVFGVVSPARMCIEPPASNGAFLDDQYDSGSGRVSTGNVSPSCFIIGTRTSSTSHVVYRNGSSLASNATSGGTFSSVSANYYIFAFNAGGAGNFSAHTLAAYSIGTGLTGTDASNYNTDMEAFQDALGRGVQ